MTTLAATARTATVMQTARSVLGTVVKAANAATDTIGMADNFVTKHSYQQKRQYAADIKVFNSTLRNETAKRIATVDAEAQEFRKQSADHAKFFDAAFDNLADLSNDDDNPFA